MPTRLVDATSVRSAALTALSAVMVLSPLDHLARASAAEEAEISFEAVPPGTWTGEPYELAGNRLVFTSWYYVRPGGYASPYRS